MSKLQNMYYCISAGYTTEYVFHCHIFNMQNFLGQISEHLCEMGHKFSSPEPS